MGINPHRRSISMQFAEFLAAEWRPALGCTEPASIAFAAAHAAQLGSGEVLTVRLVSDARIFKNCYAVGIPFSGHKVGLRWALAIGALLPDPSLKLECFRGITPEILAAAGRLIDEERIQVEVDPGRRDLFIDVTVVRAEATGRAVIESEHTRLTRLERNGVPEPLDVVGPVGGPTFRREELGRLRLGEMISLARAIGEPERAALRRGAALNGAIAEHGLGLLPPEFAAGPIDKPQARAARLVCGGVYARMSGEDFVVMSIAGSGNKGITCSVPLPVYGEAKGQPQERIDEALALTCLITSLTTWKLGSLSAVCGGSNAAGTGLAAGLVLLAGGGEREVSLALNNMVGNVSGMVCDGAKIGCGLKTMTAVDAAFRAASLAMSGVGIPYTDGIVGVDGLASVDNLARLANLGMVSVDQEILAIMKEKLV